MITHDYKAMAHDSEKIVIVEFALLFYLIKI